MKYIICCDFASLKCSRREFAKRLSEFSSDFLNLNTYTWEVELNELNFIPYNPDNMCVSIYVMLSDLLDKDSFFIVFKASESFSNDSAQFTT